MIRHILIGTFLFLAPFIFYGLYLLSRGRKNELPGAFRRGPSIWLMLCGFALMTLGLISLAVFSGEDPNAIYEPAQYEDGKLIPGGFVRKPEPEGAGSNSGR
jgi:ABC-type multidrug transport system permease subunit